MFKKPRCILAAMLLSGVAVNANAATIAYDYTAVSLNAPSVFAGSVGLDFRVNTPISIFALGVFDNGSFANLAGLNNGGVNVALYNLTTMMQVGPVVSFTPTSAGTQTGAEAFKSVSPFVLSAGSYTVVASGADIYNSNGSANPSSTTNSGGGLISFIGAGRFNGANGLTFPGSVDAGPANRYDAGSFQYSPVVSPVPEPESLALFSFGLLFLTQVRRRAK